MRISDWSSDVCSSDLAGQVLHDGDAVLPQQRGGADAGQLEKLWGIDRAPREDDLALRFDRLPAALALIFHAHGTPVLHEDAGRLGACTDPQVASAGGCLEIGGCGALAAAVCKVGVWRSDARRVG